MIYDTRLKYKDNIMSQSADVLRIVEEDILRIIDEAENKRILLKSIETKVGISDSFVFKAVSDLRKKNLIKFIGNFVELTKNGQSRANSITKRYLTIENYFKRIKSETEAHKAADILEHYISEEVINNIKKLSTLKESGVSLTKFKIEKGGLITNIVFKDAKLLERIVSMGISLGEKITVTNKIPNSIIIKVKNKKIALDKEIANGIKVLEYEKF